MADKSSYLRYLPPALWRDEPGPGTFSLGAMLRIFEKVLTGIPDGVSLPHGEHEHGPITGTIDRLDRLFNAWQTPEPFLAWLASWVALDFPTLRDELLWDEHQRRKLTAKIAASYRTRGLRTLLNRYLALFAVSGVRARVTLDDGAGVLQVMPCPGRIAPVTGLVTQRPFVVGDAARMEGMTRPSCVAVGGDGSLFVGDVGLPPGSPVQLKSRVWRLSPTGPDLAGTPPSPQPLARDTLPLSGVAAVAVRPALGAAAETLYVLDRPGKLFAIRRGSEPAPFQDAPATEVTSLAAADFSPVAMATDPTSGDLLILDRGTRTGTPSPRVITVRPEPVTVTRTPLRRVTEPLSLTVEPDGALLVGDGGVQQPAAPTDFSGNLVRIDRTTATWTETPLLPPGNPLVAPTGLAHTRDGRLYVLDAGLKPVKPATTDPFICAMAEHAAVFRVDLAATPPVAVRITEPAQFVYPTGVAATDDRLVVCDPGQPDVPDVTFPFWSRVRPFQFSIVIHFTDALLPPDPDRHLVLRQTVGAVMAVVDEQKPAHTIWKPPITQT